MRGFLVFFFINFSFDLKETSITGALSPFFKFHFINNAMREGSTELVSTVA